MQLPYLFVAVSLDGRIMGVRFNEGEDGEGLEAQPIAGNPNLLATMPPAGRPKGSRNKATLAVEALLDGEAEAITRKAIELAKNGDLAAIRLCLDRIAPPRKDRPVLFALPALGSEFARYHAHAPQRHDYRCYGSGNLRTTFRARTGKISLLPTRKRVNSSWTRH